MASAAQSVSFPLGTAQLEGYLARPEGDGPFPGVVVIHELFGLNENIRDIARRFADAGYIALAVDLFAGRNRAVLSGRADRGRQCQAWGHRFLYGRLLCHSLGL